MQRNVLLLNQNYVPVGVISWRKAVGLVLGREKAHVLERYLDSMNPSYFDAAVVRLLVKSPNPYTMWERHKFSKRNVFLRDMWECLYCGVILSGSTATVDHVMPRSRGGKTHYHNCATSCKRCNSKKNDRTPEEASMNLRKPLRRPNLNDLFNGYRSLPGEWREYIPNRG